MAKKPKNKSTGPAWARSTTGGQPKAPRRPSTPFDHACADLAEAMQRIMRASTRDCYGEGAELALDLGPRALCPPAPGGTSVASREPVMVAFTSALPVEEPGRIVVRCVCDNDEHFWVLTAALGPSAASLAREWWRWLDQDAQRALPLFPDTCFLTLTVVAPHEAPPALRREQPYCAFQHDGRDYFILTTRVDSERQGHRASLTELEVLVSIAELLARAGEDADFDTLPDGDPSGQMTRLAFVGGDGGDVRIEWGAVARPGAPFEDDEASFDEEHEPLLRWTLVDPDTVERLAEQAARLQLAEHWSESEAPRRVTVVWMDSPLSADPDDEDDDHDDVLALHERYLSFLDTTTLEQLSFQPIAERTLPGAVQQILDFFEHERGGLLPHELLVEDLDLLDAFSNLLSHRRNGSGLPIVEVALPWTLDAASRFARAHLAHALCVVREVQEREDAQRSPQEVAESHELRDSMRLNGAAAFLEFHSEHVRGIRSIDFADFVFDGADDDSVWRRDSLAFEEDDARFGELARQVLAAVHPRGDGWLADALEDGSVLGFVVEPLRTLLDTAPDLYLVNAVEVDVATLVSLTTGAGASLPLTTLVPEPEPGEVLPLRRWPFGVSELWLPAGKPLSPADADGLLERVRGEYGGVDAAAMRAATELILRESFVVSSPSPDEPTP